MMTDEQWRVFERWARDMAVSMIEAQSEGERRNDKAELCGGFAVVKRLFPEDQRHFDLWDQITR